MFLFWTHICCCMNSSAVLAESILHCDVRDQGKDSVGLGETFLPAPHFRITWRKVENVSTKSCSHISLKLKIFVVTLRAEENMDPCCLGPDPAGLWMSDQSCSLCVVTEWRSCYWAVVLVKTSTLLLLESRSALPSPKLNSPTSSLNVLVVLVTQLCHILFLALTCIGFAK